MCDTLYASGAAARDKLPLFAKNSDRPPNEAQYLDWIPAREYRPGEPLKCTYLEIPQVERTAAVLLSRPFWMWGAEMGLNEHGVVIGNEAVFSKIPANKEPALLGMDLLRLGLERGQTALDALEVITALLEEFGQGGNCIQDGHLYYQNSFLIADPNQAWVLETVDRHWAAKQVDPIYSISNLLSLGESWDRSSPGLREFMLAKGLSNSETAINLAEDFSDLIYTTFSDGGRRCKRSRGLLENQQGELRIQNMAAILRDHTTHPDPRSGIAGADICMHASLGPIRVSQTTASLIASLDEDQPLVFATGTSAPCTGIFKPVWVDAPLSLPGPIPTNTSDRETLFWSHERLHREVMGNYPAKLASFRAERDALEEEFISGAIKLRKASREERQAYSENCFQRAAEATGSWLKKAQQIPDRPALIHSAAWKGFNKQAGMI